MHIVNKYVWLFVIVLLHHTYCEQICLFAIVILLLCVVKVYLFTPHVNNMFDRL